MPPASAARKKAKARQAKRLASKRIVKSMTKSQAKQIVAKGSELKQFRKRINDDLSTATLPNAIHFVNLVDIPQGDAANERVGSKIKLSSIRLNLTFNIASTTSDMYAVRLFLVKLNKYNQLDLTSAYSNWYKDENYNILAPIYGNYNGLQQLVNKDIMSVMYEKTIMMVNETNTCSGSTFPKIRNVNINKKISKVMNYDRVNNTDVYEPIYLLVHCMNIDGHTDANVLNLRGYLRTYYTDM